MIVKKYYKLIRVSHEDSAYLRLKNISNEAGIFKMVKTGSPTAPNLEYSLDGVTWTTYDFTTLPEVAVAAGANIYFRGTNANQKFNTNTTNYVSFNFNKTCEGHGNMCSLFNPDPAVFSTITSIGAQGLACLFRDFTSLTTAPGFGNVNSFGADSFTRTFENCTSLVTVPDFSNFTSIGNTSMKSTFKGCTSLTTAPDFSNVTSIGAAAIPEAFSGCASLKIGLDLSNVTSLGSTGNYGSLVNLYRNCSKLYDVTAPNLQNLGSEVLKYWLEYAGIEATETKVVRVPTGATITTGSTSGIPTGWTRVDY